MDLPEPTREGPSRIGSDATEGFGVDARALVAPDALARNKALLDVMPMAVYVCALSGEITCYNEKAVELWGRRPRTFDARDRFCGGSRMYFPDGRSMPHDETPMAEVLRKGGSVRNGEAIIERPDGSCVAVQANIRSLFDRNGERIGAVNAFQDVTELRLAREERERLVSALERAVRARDEFLLVASHELRTPITALTLQVDGLLRVLSSEDTAAKLTLERMAGRARIVRDQLTRLSALIENLLDVSKIESGRLDLKLEPVDLAAVASEVAHRLKSRALEVGSALDVEVEPGVIGVWDRARLGQVITNLVDNALRYGRGRPVAIRVAKDVAVARLSVRDHGIGIEPEHHERVFERFERASPARSYGGLGLGLWISRNVVTAMGGRISVDSKPGEGATFTVELPSQAA
jgi:PAS domain S-box-containing protein